MIILYIPLTSKKCRFQPQNSVFLRNNNPFSIKPTAVWVKSLQKKNINFSSLRSRYNRLTNRKKLILPLEKYFFKDGDITPDIYFADEVVLQCDVPKNTPQYVFRYW